MRRLRQNGNGETVERASDDDKSCAPTGDGVFYFTDSQVPAVTETVLVLSAFPALP